MNLKNSVFLIFLSLQWLMTGCNQDTDVRDSLKVEALKDLRLNLQTQSEWKKVHAAEYLIKLGYSAEVNKEFTIEQQRHEDESPYRIGIWRVLAQASSEPEVKSYWTGKIMLAYKNKEGRDRLHAVETLSKLKIPILREAPETTEVILNGEKTPFFVYALWGASLMDSTDVYKKSIVDLAISRDANDTLRRQAAYALRNIGSLEQKQWNHLRDVALSEDKKSLARTTLLSAAYITASEDVIASDKYKKIQHQLLEAKNSPVPGDRIEMCTALAMRGTQEELPALIPLLQNKDPINADVQSAAAFAILKIDGRKEHRLALGDWIVISVYLLGMLGIGIYYARRNKSERDFFLGGGKMNPVAVGLSLFATLLSSLSYLSYPGEMVKYGPVVLTGVLAFPLVYYLVGWFLIPKFMNLNVTSAYQILEMKLGLSIRMLAIFFFLSLRLLWMATIIYVTTNIAIISIFHIHPSYSLIISTVLMVITITYTSLGGLKAVVLTDVIQSVVLLGGAFITLVVVSNHFGSFTSWLPDHWLPQWSELKFAFDPQERLTVGNATLMVAIWMIASSGSDQMSIQRFLATKDIQSARRTFGVSLFTNFSAQMLLGLVGLALIAYFNVNPQYLTEGQSLSDQADRLFPKFILVGLPVGISGLVAAGILAAAMSSLSSGLNSSSSVISEDVIKRFKSDKAQRNNSNEMKRVRRLSLLVGMLTLLLSIIIGYVEGNLYDIIVKVVNLFVSPLFVLFFMALFVPFATTRGTFIGGVASITIAIAIAFFDFLGIEILFIMPVALFTGILVGAVISYVEVRIMGKN